jgi:hypothetical protein
LWTVIPLCIFLFVLFGVSVFSLAEGMMRSSGAYQLALDKASQSSCVIASIGTPLKPGWFISGSINLNNSNGEANLSIPVRGPGGKGEINVEATKTNGLWRVKSLDFEGDNGRMQLIPEPPGGACVIVNPSDR